MSKRKTLDDVIMDYAREAVSSIWYDSDFQEISWESFTEEMDAIRKWREFEENLKKAVRRKVKI